MGKSVNQDTPAICLSLHDLVNNRRAMTDCLEKIPPEDIKTILDIRYGTGGWAKAALRLFKEATLDGYEQDASTTEEAWKDKRVRLRVERWGPRKTRKTYDLLLADFNMTTALSRHLLDEAVKAVNPRWLVFTDVACVKLHLNFRAYGLVKPCLEDYWRVFRLPGFRHVGYSRRHHAACTAVFVREEVDEGKKKRP